jgi:hypothetical protein
VRPGRAHAGALRGDGQRQPARSARADEQPVEVQRANKRTLYAGELPVEGPRGVLHARAKRTVRDWIAALRQPR